jgi:hypothetical protein
MDDKERLNRLFSALSQMNEIYQGHADLEQARNLAQDALETLRPLYDELDAAATKQPLKRGD